MSPTRREEPPMSDISPVPRPNPLGQAASKIGVAWAAASGVVGALVTFGVLTAAQGDAVTAAGQAAESTTTALGTVIGGVIPLIGAIVTAFRTTAGAKDQVTPIADPRNNAGVALTPDVGVAAVTQSPNAGATVADRDPVGPTSSGPTVGDSWTS